MGKVYFNAMDLIGDAFKEFQIFTSITHVNFDQFAITKDNNLNAHTNQIVLAEVVLQDGIPNLHYNPEILKFNGRHMFSILFHEFAHVVHMLDAIKAGVNYYSNLMRVKSEFIASEIEMEYMFGVKKIDTCFSPDIKEEIFYIFDNQPISPKDYAIANLEKVRRILSQNRDAYKCYSINDYHRIYLDMHNSAMYYFGKKTAYEKLLGKPLGCEEKDYFLEFNDIMQRLGYLAETPYNEEILKVDSELYEEFKKYFPNDNLGEQHEK